MAETMPSDERVETESTNVDGDQVNPVTESSMSLGSEAQTETTESTRSLVHRNMADERNRDIPTEITETEEAEETDERTREKSPESDTTAAPSIGPVVLRDIKKRRRLERTCAPDGGRGLSSVYAVVLVLVALVMSLREALEETWMTEYTVAAFATYLYVVAIIFLLGVEIHLLKRSSRRAKILKERDKLCPSSPDGTLKKGLSASYNPAFERDSVFINGLGGMQSEQNLAGAGSQAQLCIVEQDENWDETMPHRTSLFLRIGTAVFGIGSLIYFGLLVKQLHEGHSPSACGKDVIIWPYYILLLFLFVQTFFVFKRPQVHIKGCPTLVRLGFMHTFATNICIWTRTLVREVLDTHLLHEYADDSDSNVTTIMAKIANDCTKETDDNLLHLATPYLLPCVLEFCILAAPAFYSLWADVAHTTEKDNKKRRRRSAHFDLPDVPVHLTEINFHKTHRGLFTGFIVLAAVAVSVILFFSYLSISDDDEVPMLIYVCTDIGLYAILFLAVAITWFHMALLTYTYAKRITVDEFLLFTAMAGLLLYNICDSFAIVQYLIDGSDDRDIILSFTDNLLCMGLSLLQTCFIVEGYSRRSTRSIHLKQKPGRGGVTFLLIANISVWLLRSFNLKYDQVRSHKPEFGIFGYLVWQIIMYGTLPFVIFYHFQSSACLAHIWIKSYRKDPPRESTPSVRSDDLTEAVTLVPTSGEIRIVELKRRIRKSTGVMEEDTVYSPVSVV